MTVAELRAVLATMEGRRVVVLSRDPEGNGFSRLDECVPADWDPNVREVLDEDIEFHPDHAQPCVVLWPTW